MYHTLYIHFSVEGHLVSSQLLAIINKASALLRRGNKIPMGGNTEITCVAETEGKAIQRLFHLGIFPLYSHQTLTLLWMLRSACWQEPDIALSWEALPEPDKYRCECSQATIGLNMEMPMKEVRKRLKELKGFFPIGRTTISTNQIPPRSSSD